MYVFNERDIARMSTPQLKQTYSTEGLSLVAFIRIIRKGGGHLFGES
jgi:hypothetical protein